MVAESHFALSLEPSTGIPGTKMSDAVTQVDAASDPTAFRGIEQIYVIPFKTYNAITASDIRHGRNLELPQLGITPSWGASANAGLVSNNNSHLYENVLMKSGTASVLVYGKAIDEAVSATPADSVAFKRRNGVLRQYGLGNAETPVDMGFDLEPIANATVLAEINTKISSIITYLNSIAKARDTNNTYYFYSYNSTNAQDFANFFSSFTNGGANGTSGQSFSGSTRGLSSILSQLYEAANNLSASSTSGRVDRLCAGIMNAINNSTYVSVSGTTVTFNSTYADVPSAYGVPEGAFAVQWNGSDFVQVSSANSTMAPAGSYCYPPCLWYWTGSRIKTTDDETIEDQYVSSNATWSSILDKYTLGSTMVPGVTSVAVVNPLQYGVAQLRLTFNYAVSEGGTANLLDSRAGTVNVSNTNFPLTGVLVSEQRDQNFNFTPKSGDNYCIFDTDVNDGGTPKVYIASSASGVTLKPVHTLVVQTESGQDVHYALEFQNDSGSSFYGVTGSIIAPGSKFYLVGELKLSESTNNTGESITSVFLQDHITEAVITVKGLAKAYNIVPELRDPQLEIGVQTEMKWVGSTPAQVPLY